MYGDGVYIGGGSDWQETFTFHTSATKVLAIVAKDWHFYEGIVLSTSNGLVVTDKSWKCIDSDLVTSTDWASPHYNDLTWPDAVSYGYYGVTPP